jgi:hypothetical protein
MPAGGGLLQLVATGKQDLFLTGNPQISFFKMVYRRHTNFAVESQPMYFDGTPDFGQRITCLIPRRGDLLGRVYMEVVLPPIYDVSGNPLEYLLALHQGATRDRFGRGGIAVADRHLPGIGSHVGTATASGGQCGGQQQQRGP